jgi:hypothetical protein
MSSSSLTFGSQPTSTTSGAKTEVVTNAGTATLSFSSVAVGGTNANDFAKSADTCSGATVVPNATCAVSVTFTPSTSGNLSASLIFTDNAPASPQAVNLAGTGGGKPAGATFSPASLNFGSQSAGTTSAAQTENVANTGATALMISTVTLGGANASDFAKSADTCSGATVAPNASCAVSVTFTPTTSGNLSASLVFTDNAPASPQTVGLAGSESGNSPGPLSGVFTQRYDNSRSGQNTQEASLTPSNVNSSQFGKLFSLPVDGQIFAQPLYMENVAVPQKGTYNIIFVATENDSVDAFDADGSSTTPLWQVSFLNPSAGVTAVPCQDEFGTSSNCFIAPVIGITSTPVIDPSSGTLYVTAQTKESQDPTCVSGCTSNYIYRLHALDVTTGAEKFGGPVSISASVPGTGYDSVGGVVTFSALHHLQRAGLLLANGTVYLAFGSYRDIDPYHGWLMAYNATTLQQVAVFNVTPNAEQGAIWQGGGGISADDNGILYVVTANGSFDVNTGGIDYGDSVLKMQIASGQFQVLDYFTPADQGTLAEEDLDLGSSPALILPDQPGPNPHLLATGGKDGRIWLLNRDKLGTYQTNDAGAVQVIASGSDSLFGGGTYWNGNLYFQEVGDFLNQFALNNGQAQTPPTSSSFAIGFPNASPVVSANGANNAVVWLVDTSSGGPAVLYAFDATNVGNQLYSSTEAPGQRDQAGPAVKFAVPTVANGKVYVGAGGEVDVYGLLPVSSSSSPE